MVFYLKYRPQKIADLDSSEVRERLLKILSSDNLPHAFLFTGPKGLGKTSTARIIAKSVNCINRKKGESEPCNKCDSCKSITAGVNLDVLEIDGASNRGIDEIRDLREKIRLSPVSSKKKVYIIDEVHMLTTEAFNALLKTLEEPPSHALFILCTTEPQKVPQTIISRCLHISFKSPSTQEMERSYKRIIKEEELNIDGEGILAIVKLSDGSFRDGAKILEEITINFGKKKVGVKEIESIFNTSSVNESVKDLVIAISINDGKKALTIIDNLAKQKIDFKFFGENLLSYLHNLLLAKFDVLQNQELKKIIDENNIDVEKIKKYIEEFSKAYSKIKFSVSPQIPIEIAIIEVTIQQKQERAIDQPRQEVQETQKKEDNTSINNGKILTDLIQKVNLENRLVAALLRGVKLDRENEEEMVLLASSQFHKERLEEPKAHELIEKMYKEITGKNKKIQISFNVRG